MTGGPEYLIKPTEINIVNSGWQLCPKCNGQGKISKPPFINGDIEIWMSSEMSYICDVCNGKKIINIDTGLPPL